MEIYKTISESQDKLKKQVIMIDDGNYFTRHIKRVGRIWQYCFSRSLDSTDQFKKKTYKYKFKPIKEKGD